MALNRIQASIRLLSLDWFPVEPFFPASYFILRDFSFLILLTTNLVYLIFCLFLDWVPHGSPFDQKTVQQC